MKETISFTFTFFRHERLSKVLFDFGGLQSRNIYFIYLFTSIHILPLRSGDTLSWFDSKQLLLFISRLGEPLANDAGLVL